MKKWEYEIILSDGSQGLEEVEEQLKIKGEDGFEAISLLETKTNYLIILLKKEKQKMGSPTIENQIINKLAEIQLALSNIAKNLTPK